MTTKVCSSCNRELPVSSFHKHATSSDGLQCYCKKCRLFEQREYRRTQAGKERDLRYERSDKKVLVWKRYRKSKRGREVSSKTNRLYYRKNIEKMSARNKLRYAVHSGKIVPPSECNMCHETRRVVAHHTDYSKPYDVQWLCVVCHKMIHGKKHLRGD